MTTEHMTTAQLNVLSELQQQLSAGRMLTHLEQLTLPDMACMIDEMRTLQKFINANGTTYQVRGKSGDTYSRQRPEYQQLNDLRKELRQMRKSLTLEAVQPVTEADAFFTAA